MYHVTEHDETALPKLYETVREHISCRLTCQAVSFTTDMWTSDVCPMSAESAHWVDTVSASTFAPQSVVLQSKQVP